RPRVLFPKAALVADLDLTRFAHSVATLGRCETRTYARERFRVEHQPDSERGNPGPSGELPWRFQGWGCLLLGSGGATPDRVDDHGGDRIALSRSAPGGRAQRLCFADARAPAAFRRSASCSF